MNINVGNKMKKVKPLNIKNRITVNSAEYLITSIRWDESDFWANILK